MRNLLFLAHRIPYPPNKGDKVRSFNLLKRLSPLFRIHLGAFVDDRGDLQHIPMLQALCEEVFAVPVHPRWRKFAGLAGLISGEALSLPYYRHSAMYRWVRRKLSAGRMDAVLVYSSPMAQYVLGDNAQGIRSVVDFVDVDSEKWRQYGEAHHWPMSWLYAREAKCLLRFERAAAARADVSVFVSRAEAELFQRLAPEVAGRVTHVANGVDTDFFNPDAVYPNPFRHDERPLVFTGAMDYWANVDAVSWFAREIFPAVRTRIPQARFWIVGARPTDDVRRLARLDGVHVTGTVEDVRPYLAHAVAGVATLRVARGIQNKVLEAMAMAKPVVATKAAMDGIGIESEYRDLIADDPAGITELAVKILRDGDKRQLGTWGRNFVLTHYSWAENLSRVEKLLDNGDAREKSVSMDSADACVEPAPTAQEICP